MRWPWSKPQKPWYNRWLTEARAAIILFMTVVGSLGGAYKYIEVDIEPFIKTTVIKAVSANQKLYVNLNIQTELDEMSYITVSLNGTQVAARVYPEGIKRGKIHIETDLPFNYLNKKKFDAIIDIYFVGPRTFFVPERMSVTTDVEVK